MPKRCSTRSGSTGRRPSQRKAAENTGRAHAGLMLAEKNTRDYAEVAHILVQQAWPKIVRGLIEKAASGGYQQAKLLADLFNLTSMDTSEIDLKHRQQLCDVLLEELGLLPARPANTADAMSNNIRANNTEMQ